MVCCPDGCEITFPWPGLFLLRLCCCLNTNCKADSRWRCRLTEKQPGCAMPGVGQVPLSLGVSGTLSSSWKEPNGEAAWKVNRVPLSPWPHWPRLTPLRQASDHLDRDGPALPASHGTGHTEAYCAYLWLALEEISKHKRFLSLSGAHLRTWPAAMWP